MAVLFKGGVRIDTCCRKKTDAVGAELSYLQNGAKVSGNLSFLKFDGVFADMFNLPFNEPAIGQRIRSRGWTITNRALLITE